MTGSPTPSEGKRRVAFVTNLGPHYRVRTFEILAGYCSIRYYFFSAGAEWYRFPGHGLYRGEFDGEYLPGVTIAGTRFVPALVSRLWCDDYDVLVKCITGRFALPTSYIVARLRRKPFVLWTGTWAQLEGFFHCMARPLTRYVYRHADAIVVYGEHVKRYLISQGVRSERVFIAPHAVDNTLYARPVPHQEIRERRAALGIAEGGAVVLFVGRLESGKGLEFLMEAFAGADVAGARLVLVGEGSKRVCLHSQAQRLRVDDRVIFVGYVPPDDTLVYYAMAAVLVLPSVSSPRGKETWGLVVNEAMNQGVPVIATEAVGAAAGGLVQNGVNGWVVPERDSLALARALRRTLRDPVLRAALSRGARRTIAGWDNERMVQGFRAAIAAVTAKG